MTNHILDALERTLKNPERLEHMELHFSENDKKLRGSTFNRDFVKNSVELLQYVSEQLQCRHFELEKNDTEMRLTIKHPNKIVGYDALLKLESLVDSDMQELKWMDRFGYQVRYIERAVQPTKSLMIILRMIDQQLVLKTIFPGCYAPAFPNEKLQSENEYKSSMKFWDKHVLIKS